MPRVERDRRRDVLVAAQVLTAAGVAWPGRGRWRLPRPVTVLAVGVGAAGSAFAAEGLRFLGTDVTPSVEPPAGARLRTAGPYSVSRHPVYLGGLVAAGAAAVLRRRPEPLVSFGLLAAVLHVKAGLEERRLAARFGVAYEEYRQRTPRLLGRPGPGA